MTLTMMGPPGAGKGTQAKLLGEKFGIPVISTGEILREAMRARTVLGEQARGFMEAGDLVPDDVMIGIVAERLRRPDCQPGFILDGFPRTVPQADALAATLAAMGTRLDLAISLDAPEQEIIRRLSGRRVCRACGQGFHLLYDPPPHPGRCGRCGGELHQREDDVEGTVRARLHAYQEKTLPLLAYYEARGLLRVVDGVGPIEEVLQRLLAVVSEGSPRA
ncbi:MAG: adenylate kinase [Deltaproteobacteria bacterium]|nr:adenylate kinase [Deltaproteobacteria bacterium]